MQSERAYKEHQEREAQEVRVALEEPLEQLQQVELDLPEEQVVRQECSMLVVSLVSITEQCKDFHTHQLV
jgi:positive regulator of sigma E activity